VVVDDKGVASCLRARSGKVLWRENLGNRHSASLVRANGLVYFLSDKGVMTIVRPLPKFAVLARNELGEKTDASPAISNGQIFLRGDKHLFCIGRSPE
jgi:outer membrane protein assembly factor BamB